MSRVHQSADGKIRPCRAKTPEACRAKGPGGTPARHFENAKAADQTLSAEAQKQYQKLPKFGRREDMEKRILKPKEQLPAYATKDEARAVFESSEKGTQMPKASTVAEQNGFNFTEAKYDSAIIGYVQRPSTGEGHPETVMFIAPNVSKLTDRKRLELGRKAWVFAGKSPEHWDSASDESKVIWTKSHMGRHNDVTLKVDGDSVDYTTNTSGGWRDIKNIILFED